MTVHADPSTHLSVPRTWTHPTTFPVARSGLCPARAELHQVGNGLRGTQGQDYSRNRASAEQPQLGRLQMPKEPRRDHDRDTWRLRTSSPRSEFTCGTPPAPLRGTWHHAPRVHCRPRHGNETIGATVRLRHPDTHTERALNLQGPVWHGTRVPGGHIPPQPPVTNSGFLRGSQQVRAKTLTRPYKRFCARITPQTAASTAAAPPLRRQNAQDF